MFIKITAKHKNDINQSDVPNCFFIIPGFVQKV